MTETYQLGRFDQVVLSSGGRLHQPTNVVAPGRRRARTPGSEQPEPDHPRRRFTDPEPRPDPVRPRRPAALGVQHAAWRRHRNRHRRRARTTPGPVTRRAPTPIGFGRPTRLGAPPSSSPPTRGRQTPPSVGGSLRVAGMNLLNFFNTFDGLPDAVDNCTLGVGGAPTDCRGADTQAELDRQLPKTVAAIVGSGADVIAVTEIENDGYGPDSAIQFLVDRLNSATAPGTYAFVDADAGTGQLNALGTDAIKVGLVYKPARVTPVGKTAALNTRGVRERRRQRHRATDRRSRRPSRENDTGATVVVVANHLKSKGSACDAARRGRRAGQLQRRAREGGRAAGRVAAQRSDRDRRGRHARPRRPQLVRHGGSDHGAEGRWLHGPRRRVRRRGRLLLRLRRPVGLPRPGVGLGRPARSGDRRGRVAHQRGRAKRAGLQHSTSRRPAFSRRSTLPISTATPTTT